jgi:hypothetical protein
VEFSGRYRMLEHDFNHALRQQPNVKTASAVLEVGETLEDGTRRRRLFWHATLVPVSAGTMDEEDVVRTVHDAADDCGMRVSATFLPSRGLGGFGGGPRWHLSGVAEGL